MPANTWPFTQLLLRRRHVEKSFLNLRKQHSGRKKAQPVDLRSHDQIMAVTAGH